MHQRCPTQVEIKAAPANRLRTRPAYRRHLYERRVVRSRRPATLRHSRHVTRAVYNPNNYQCIWQRQIINGVRGMKRHPQARRKLFARGARKRKMPQRFEMRLDRRNKPRRHLFGGHSRQGRPDIGQISFRRFSEAER